MPADRKLWEILPAGSTRAVVDFGSTVGLAPIGTRDGRLHRRDLGGWCAGTAEDIQQGDPVSERMVEAVDGGALYVAQIFRGINPIVQDDRLWRLPLSDGSPTGRAELVFRTGGIGGLDGLAMDELGRVYIAASREGRLWRFDARDGSSTLIGDSVAGIASLAFGVPPAGDPLSVYATQLRGGRVWAIQTECSQHADAALMIPRHLYGGDRCSSPTGALPATSSVQVWPFTAASPMVLGYGRSAPESVY